MRRQENGAAKTSTQIIDEIAQVAGNLPTMDDLMKMVPSTSFDGGFDRPEYPDRHYICINWASEYEFRNRINLIQQRVRAGYVPDPEHPLANNSTLFMYTSVAAHDERQKKLAAFSDFDPTSGGVEVKKRAAATTPEVEEAMQELADAHRAATEDGI